MKFLMKLVVGIIVLAVVVVGIVIGFGYHGYKQAIKKQPLEEYVSLIQQQPQYVSYEEVSSYFLNAVVAIEDHRFYEHMGIDVFAIMRSTLTNLIAQDIVGGGSTITQQLAKNMYFDQSQSFTRKISEAFVSNDLEQTYTKEEILALYINVIYFGDQHYGIQEASLGYFNVLPSELNLFQASLLAGLPQAPSAYALSYNYEAAIRRQQDVLKAMLEHGYITQEQYEDTKQ